MLKQIRYFNSFLIVSATAENQKNRVKQICENEKCLPIYCLFVCVYLNPMMNITTG